MDPRSSFKEQGGGGGEGKKGLSRVLLTKDFKWIDFEHEINLRENASDGNESFYTGQDLLDIFSRDPRLPISHLFFSPSNLALYSLKSS